MLPARASDFPERIKPWGTAQALYCCKDILHENFGVINADDFYGKNAFLSLAGFLNSPDAYACSVGFTLKNTLSENGPVNRGICHINKDGLLMDVIETRNITKDSHGIISGMQTGKKVKLDENDTVSMSMWGFAPSFTERLSRELGGFIASLPFNELSAELTVADSVDTEIKQYGFDVRNLVTDSRWYGITYEADAELVRRALCRQD